MTEAIQHPHEHAGWKRNHDMEITRWGEEVE
jgi:hypothetical protein